MTKRILWLLTDVLLAFMLAGPIVAPAFQALGWPLFREVSQFVYGLGEWICPQDYRIGYVLGGQMIVCTRCLAALAGLAAVRLAYRGGDPLARLGLPAAYHWPVRILSAAAAWAAWTVDVHGEDAGLWVRPEWALAAGGLWLGLGIGLVVYGLLSLATRSRSARLQGVRA